MRLRWRSIALFVLVAAIAPARAELRATFLHPLQDSVGRLSFGWAPLAWDAGASELYIVDAANGAVDVFNDNGLVVYSFGDAGLGVVRGVAPLDDGDLLLLTMKGAETAVVRCNFRGEPRGTIAPSGVPAALAQFLPTSIYAANGAIYLANLSAKKVLLLELDGRYRASFDLLALAGLSGKERAGALVRGFGVDRAGNLLFTIATSFRAFVVAPGGQVQSFGSKGSLPGKFNVAGGIAADEDGHLFVADTLRSVVMAFDARSFEFLGEFGHRGRSKDSLINPLEIAVGHGRIYVTQSVGPVKAFGVSFE